MRSCRLLALALSAALVVPALISSEAFAEDRPLCSVASTSPTATTTTCSNKINAARISVQCNGAAYVGMVATSTTLATSANVKVAADALYDVPYGGLNQYLSVLAVAGTVTCQVFARIGTTGSIQPRRPPEVRWAELVRLIPRRRAEDLVELPEVA